MKMHAAKTVDRSYCGRLNTTLRITNEKPDCEVCLHQIEQAAYEKNIPVSRFFKSAKNAPSVGVKNRLFSTRLVSLKKEVEQLKTARETLIAQNNEKFDQGFVMGLILLVRNYAPLHEHAFNILQEAGFEYGDFSEMNIDSADRDVLNKIFSF
jgi:hypothetical protein